MGDQVLTAQVVNSIGRSAICFMAAPLILLLMFAGAAPPLQAGTLSGNVKASRGESVIYLAPVRRVKFTPKSQTYVIHQKGMRFTPTLLVVPEGATVEFPNEDLAPHNVYWKSIAGNPRLSHDLGIVARGHKAVWTFSHAGDVPILCSFHKEMTANIIVAPSPYFAKVDEILGDYFIAGVPDGKYKVSVWHNGTTTSKLVTVAGDTRANFTLTR
jgi:plastocyanin